MLNSAVVTAVERFVTASDEPFAIAKRISLTLNSGLPKCRVCFLLKKSKSGIAPTAIPIMVPSPAPIIPKSHTAIKRMSSTMFVQPDSIENKHDMWLVCCYKVRLVEHLPAHYKAVRNHNAAVVNAVGENLFV